MELGNVSQKQINELEQTTTQLLKTMRSAKLHTSPLYRTLQEFEQMIGKERRTRYDENNSMYPGY